MISLGGNCSVAYNLERYNKRIHSYPFDWCDIKINQLINVLENDFLDYNKLQIKKFSSSHSLLNSNNGSYILTNIYKIKFAHELLDVSNKELLEETIDRRIKRFRKLENVKFIRLETRNISNKYFREKYLKLYEIIKKYNSELIVITKNIWNDSPFKIIKLDDFDENWYYPKVDWKNLFKNI